MSDHRQTIYKLRNTPELAFAIEAEALELGAEGCTVQAKIQPIRAGNSFRYEVCFLPAYCQSKPAFTPEMYLETALSLVHSQLESHVHRDTRIRIEVNSGLPRTEVGCKLNW